MLSPTRGAPEDFRLASSHITQEHYIGGCYATLRVISVFYVTG